MTGPRHEAAAALLESLRELDKVLVRLQVAAAWVLEAYGDPADAETVRMLRIPSGPLPGRPAVPPPAARSGHLLDDPEGPPAEDPVAELAPGATWVAKVRRALGSVTHDEIPGGER